MKLTESQRRTFFAALRPAAEEVGEKVEDYRRRILREELAKMSRQSVSVLSERLVSESAWMEFTEGQLKRLLMMLQTHLRRT